MRLRTRTAYSTVTRITGAISARRHSPPTRPAGATALPGIGLARLGGLPVLDNGRVRRDVEAAIRTTLRMDQQGPDHLCCGNLGRADLLLVAGRHLDRPDLVDAAGVGVDRVARRARAAGGFSLHTTLSHRVHMPGFFMGTSGISWLPETCSASSIRRYSRRCCCGNRDGNERRPALAARRP